MGVEGRFIASFYFNVLKARGLTQEKLAELMDLTPVAITKIEAGDRFPKAETLEALQKALQVSYKDLFDFGNQTDIKIEENIIYIASKLNDKGKELLYKIMTNVLQEMDEYKS